MGLRLSQEKTLITHIDQGLDFLGWRIQRHRKRGSNRRYVYTYPAKKALRAVTGKVKTLCRQVTNLPLAVLLHRLNPQARFSQAGETIVVASSSRVASSPSSVRTSSTPAWSKLPRR